MKRKLALISSMILTVALSACADNSAPDETTPDVSGESVTGAVEDTALNWDSIVEKGSNTEVQITMWGGNDLVNQYMDGYVASNLEEMYGITLKRAPMNAPDFVSKIFNEKKNGVEEGTIDILWINAENFRTLKDFDALYGPFTDALPNQAEYFDPDLALLTNDSGIEVDGKEALWGSAQLVFTYDSAKVENPPKSYAEILEYAKANPGSLTYPNPMEDFVGSGFVRNAYFELTDADYTEDYTYEEFLELSAPVIEYFKELHPYLWNEGEAFPATVALQNQMLVNGETDLSYGFEVFQTSGLIKSGEYAETFDTYVLDTKTVSNSHYLAIPFNSINKEGAMLVIDFMQSPEAQIEKMKPDVWGDLAVIDANKLTEEQQQMLAEIEKAPAIIPVAELAEKRHVDMNAKYIDWVEQVWDENIIG